MFVAKLNEVLVALVIVTVSGPLVYSVFVGVFCVDTPT